MRNHRKQRIFGIVGRSGSGKTHLISRLVQVFRQKGVSVSTIKHTHHGVDMDTPGKDTFQHRESGAVEVMLATPERWVLQHQSASPPILSELVHAMRPVDLVLIEGFHADVPACMEVWRSVTGKEPLFPQTPHILAVATDTQSLPDVAHERTVFPLDETENIALYIQKHAFLWGET